MGQVGQNTFQRYFAPADAAAYLGVDVGDLRRFDDLPRCIVRPRTIRYDFQDLREYRDKLPLPTYVDGLVALMRLRLSEHRSDGGFVYFIRCDRLIKIGYSRRPVGRLDDLQAVIPFELTLIGYVPGSVAAERALHAAFGSIRYGQTNEWFAPPSLALLYAIKTVTEAGNG